MSYETKINALKSINFFIGGLTEEGVNHYYEQMVRVGRIKEEKEPCYADPFTDFFYEDESNEDDFDYDNL